MSRAGTTRSRRGALPRALPRDRGVVDGTEYDTVLRLYENTPGERSAARLTVAAHAVDVADCRTLLDCLGLS